MPYQVTLWVCRTCHTNYPGQTEAKRCENTGCEPLVFQVGDRVRCMSPVPQGWKKAARVYRVEFLRDSLGERPHVPLYDLRFEHDAEVRIALTANCLVGIDEDAPGELPLSEEVCYAVESEPLGPFRSLWRRCESFFRSLRRDD